MAGGRGYGYGYGDGSGDGYGDGYSYGSGYGSGYGYGYRSGYGYGDGNGYGYGDGDGLEVGSCGQYKATLARPWGYLRVGCEIHSLADWIARADEIDAKHGDGIADETRALARKLMKENPDAT